MLCEYSLPLLEKINTKEWFFFFFHYSLLLCILLPTKKYDEWLTNSYTMYILNNYEIQVSSFDLKKNKREKKERIMSRSNRWTHSTFVLFLRNMTSLKLIYEETLLKSRLRQFSILVSLSHSNIHISLLLPLNFA